MSPYTKELQEKNGIKLRVVKTKANSYSRKLTRNCNTSAKKRAQSDAEEAEADVSTQPPRTEFNDVNEMDGASRQFNTTTNNNILDFKVAEVDQSDD